MIDQDKMRFMATRLRAMDLTTCAEAADAIDLLLAEVEALQTCKLCRSTGPDVPCAYPTEINRQQAKTINSLRAELEAAAADKRDAERYRWLRELDSEFWEVNRMSNMARFYGETLDAEIDAALAQRQGEGS